MFYYSNTKRKAIHNHTKIDIISQYVAAPRQINLGKKSLPVITEILKLSWLNQPLSRINTHSTDIFISAYNV